MPTAFFFLAYGFFSSFNLEKSYFLLIEAHSFLVALRAEIILTTQSFSL